MRWPLGIDSVKCKGTDQQNAIKEPFEENNGPISVEEQLVFIDGGEHKCIKDEISR